MTLPDRRPTGRRHEMANATDGRDDARERAWVERVRNGDAEAFDAMVGAYYERLCRFAASLVRSNAVAEELVQDTLLAIWRQRERWEVTTTLEAYLYGAVRNRAIGHLRRQAVERQWQDRVAAQQVSAVPGPRPPEPDEELFGTELAAVIDRAIAELQPRCREAFLLRRQHGLSYARIAEIMQIAPKTVEVQIGAALRALRAALRDWL